MHRNIHNPIKLTLLVLTHSLHFTKKKILLLFLVVVIGRTIKINCWYRMTTRMKEKNSPLEGDSLIFIAAGQFWCRSFWENKHMDQKFCFVLLLFCVTGRQKKGKEDFLRKGEKVFMLMDIWTVTFNNKKKYENSFLSRVLQVIFCCVL